MILLNSVINQHRHGYFLCLGFSCMVVCDKTEPGI